LPLVAARYVRRPGWWLLGAFAVSAGWKLATRTYGIHWAMQFPTYAIHFALGMTAACIYVRRDELGWLVRWAPVGQGASFASFVFFASRFVDTEALHRFIDNLPMAFSFALFVLFTALRPRSLRPGPLAFVSRVSYGIYLFHILVIGRLLRFVAPDGSAGAFVKVAALTGAISLVVGWLSLRFVETPVRNWASAR
jgi:peptidoglycan/LPS O-acetylase OafA/YrhL